MKHNNIKNIYEQKNNYKYLQKLYEKKHNNLKEEILEIAREWYKNWMLSEKQLMDTFYKLFIKNKITIHDKIF